MMVVVMVMAMMMLIRWIRRGSTCSCSVEKIMVAVENNLQIRGRKVETTKTRNLLSVCCLPSCSVLTTDSIRWKRVRLRQDKTPHNPTSLQAKNAQHATQPITQAQVNAAQSQHKTQHPTICRTKTKQTRGSASFTRKRGSKYRSRLQTAQHHNTLHHTT